MLKTRLFKKDTKGKIRVLDIWSEDDILYQEAGLLDGKKVLHSKACKPKNVGKSNSTTAAQQANVQGLALAIKKRKEGYFTTKEEAISTELVLPMLAKDYFKYEQRIPKNDKAYQPKLDGVRCMVFWNSKEKSAKGISRTNKPIDNIDHILEPIIELNHPTDFVLDGELYLHGSTFQEVSKLVKNKPNKVYVEYHVYDTISDEVFKGRQLEVEYLVDEINSKYILPVSTIYGGTKADKELYQEYISQGYEGMMVRDANSKYKINGRSDKLLKYKEFIDVQLKIIDVTPNDSNPMHGTVWVNYNGKKVKTGAKLSHSDREELLINKDDYIGKVAEIRYFEETDDGSLRFPVYHGLRIDK